VRETNRAVQVKYIVCVCVCVRERERGREREREKKRERERLRLTQLFEFSVNDVTLFFYPDLLRY